jgi:APA family basic amino acid/polyamine antiporter
MARDGVFFKGLANVHPKFNTPVNAIVLQCLWACFLLVTGTFGTLFTYVSVIITLFSAFTVGAVIVLRYKRPDLPRPYKLWGYPLVPILFILTHLWIVWGSVRQNPFETLIGLAIVCVGIPAYLIWRSRSPEAGA